MKIAFILFDDMTALDLVGVFDPLTRLKTMGFMEDLSWDLCATQILVRATGGLELRANQVLQPLVDYDLLVTPGGNGTRALEKDEDFLRWFGTCREIPLKAAVCTGALLMGAAGFLKGRRATTHPGSLEALKAYAGEVLRQRVVDDGDILTAGGVTAGIDLGLYLVERLAGAETAMKIRAQMDYKGSIGDKATGDRGVREQGSIEKGERRGRVSRKTGETVIEVVVGLDGTGRAEISSGVGFLDHMLRHVAVHGLLDLKVRAQGDLEVDAHHTVEDVALALGKAVDEALGERRGILRIANASVPMDEALAQVVIDLSGRPYAVIQAEWHAPMIGALPTSLVAHFFESFASAGRMNLHARLEYSRDDHHGAEALFKALGRALGEAARIDPRRAGGIPSTKGTLSA